MKENMSNELPDNWEDIDVNRMRLPKSKKERKKKHKVNQENMYKPKPLLATALANVVLKQYHATPALHPPKKTSKERKNETKRKKKTCQQQVCSKRFVQDDCIVERKPVYTTHARQRIAQGRCGEFVTAKKGNAVVVITVLPQGSGERKRLQNIRIHENRKSKSIKYKVR